MDYAPILAAAPEIQLHASAALVALVLGPVAILRPRRDRLHRALGYVWMVAMITAALSSFWIHSFALIGGFSPIHLLSLLALWSIWLSLRAAFRGDYRLHAIVLRNLYWRGVLIAGLFNFLPGRTVNRVFFEATPRLGAVVIGVGMALILADLLRQRRAGSGGRRAAARIRAGMAAAKTA